MERSFFLKKRRADFVAGSLSGRVVVAGGLGKAACPKQEWAVAFSRSLAPRMNRRKHWLLACHLPTAGSPRVQSVPFLLACT